jgi:hypothetical protein
VPGPVPGARASGLSAPNDNVAGAAIPRGPRAHTAPASRSPLSRRQPGPSSALPAKSIKIKDTDTRREIHGDDISGWLASHRQAVGAVRRSNSCRWHLWLVQRWLTLEVRAHIFICPLALTSIGVTYCFAPDRIMNIYVRLMLIRSSSPGGVMGRRAGGARMRGSSRTGAWRSLDPGRALRAQRGGVTEWVALGTAPSPRIDSAARGPPSCGHRSLACAE